ncbi:MAG TPA: alpha-L-fucosidase [Candidatus Acidoferrum sp.]|nr:alpha-L-fucosidase [Candidatus Acidoferrum sp.]
MKFILTRTPRARPFLAAALLLAVWAAGISNSAPAQTPDESTASAQFAMPAKDSPESAWWRDSMKTRDERMEWWREARFGLFMHWGVYSSLGNEYQGRKGGTYAEHIMRILKIPFAEYRAEVAGHFFPSNFNADTWVSLAKQAGMGYIVITSKHHDGLAMWPTKVNHYNVMDATPWHHDPMQDLRAACQRQGVKFGFYYSAAMDWGDSNAPGNNWEFHNPSSNNWWETHPEFEAKARKYVDEKAIPQVLELIRIYDPDILWFDVPSHLPPADNYRIMKAVRQASPRVVINGRLLRGWGDYDSTTDRPAEFPPHAGDWEGIPTTDESYGWNKFDNSHKPPSHFIQLLAKAAARGGNILLNVGPMGDGNIDPKDVAILQGIGVWWQVNGQSIRGTTRTPLPVQTWGETTVHAWSASEHGPFVPGGGATIYLHVFNWPTNGQLVVGGLKSTDLGIAYLLADDFAAHTAGGLSPLKVSRLNPLDVCISVPANAPDKADSVVVLNCETNDVQADTNRLLQPEFPTNTLRAFDGELRGRGLRFGPGKKTDAYAENWTQTNQFVAWPARLAEPASFDAGLLYDAPAASRGGTFTVSFGGQSLSGTVVTGTNVSAALGRVRLAAGTIEIRLQAGTIQGGELMRPRSLVLTAAH